MLFSEINQLPPFEAGLPIWDFHEPVSSNPGSYTLKPLPVTSNSGPYEQNRQNSKTLTSCPRLAATIDERKLRRMKSNRDSARRSRVRKQKHLEDLRSQLDRLSVENRELMDRFGLAAYNDELICLENEQLRSEAEVLRQRLWDLRQVLLVQQLQQQLNPLSAWSCINNFTYINEEQLPVNTLIA